MESSPAVRPQPSASKDQLWLQRNHWDAIIVGAGAAGLYTALCLPRTWQVLLLTKETLKLSASGWAQGGIAAAIAPEDSPELHISDTLRAGAGLCEPDVVKFLVNHAPDCIHALVDLGVAFDRAGESGGDAEKSIAGSLAMTREAAHSRSRVLHAADRTGKAVVTTLAEQLLLRDNIQVGSRAFVLHLWMAGPRCQGVAVVQAGRLHWVRSSRVILATGGGGQVFSNTTNPPLSTGDGIALAQSAGAQLRDLEFFQFHPTALMKPGAPRFLISEAVRGEGAYLRDDTGDRFMLRYHQDAELAPRDVVSRSIFQHLQKNGQNRVWLDLSPIPEAQIRHRFPNIIRVCQKWGVDLFQGPIPVAPAAHYWMGGIVTDTWGQTTVPGLYAVGETASTGVHGANRLASNSLLECIVFGRWLGRQPREDAQEARTGTVVGEMNAREAREASERETSEDVSLQPFSTGANGSTDGETGEETGKEMGQKTSETLNPNNSRVLLHSLLGLGELEEARERILALRHALAQTLWAGAGICRDRAGMEAAFAEVRSLHTQFDALSISQALRILKTPLTASQTETPEMNRVETAPVDELVRSWGELDNLLTVGELILKSALFRQESRGGHYRLDFPEPREEWRAHTLVEGGELRRSPPIPNDTLL